MRLLVTGSCGLIGSGVSCYFGSLGWQVFGIDNDSRAMFFGREASTKRQRNLLVSQPWYQHADIDIRNFTQLREVAVQAKPDLVVHAAAQPSHDWAASDPFTDFDINARATLRLLEIARTEFPSVPFVFLSTNKVYGDAPNRLQMVEGPKRFDLLEPINETLAVDGSLHSLFGCSKLAADILVQEYGRNFGMPTVALRCGCLTGGAHAGAEQHGFLSYLAKCIVQGKQYTIHGYKGKQVRDNLHAYDVARFIEEFAKNPRPGEVYNLGGGFENSCSIIEAREAFEKLSCKTHRSGLFTYREESRMGDHISYVSDLSKAKRDYPEWSVTRSLTSIYEEIVQAWSQL